jgi:hypothetical protein
MKLTRTIMGSALLMFLSAPAWSHEVKNIDHTHAFQKKSYGEYRQGHYVNGPQARKVARELISRALHRLPRRREPPTPPRAKPGQKSSTASGKGVSLPCSRNFVAEGGCTQQHGRVRLWLTPTGLNTVFFAHQV